MDKKDLKKLRAKLWQAFLKASIICAMINIFVFGCCLDSETNIPLYVIIASLLWLGFMLWANLPEEELEGGRI